MRNFSIDIVWAKVQMAFTVIGGWIGYFVGGVDGLMTALLIFMVLDYVTGLMCAIADKKLSSAVGFKGICKKVLIIMLVGVAHVVDLHVVGTGDALRSAVVCFYLSNEGVSMLENAALMDAVADDDGQPDTPEQPAPEEPAPVGTTVVIVSQGGKVNVRCGNGTEYARISAVAPGSTFPHVATAQNGWHTLVIGSRVGWVSGNFAKIV